MTSPSPTADAITPLSTSGRYLVLVCAFLGWLCAGMHMSITQLAGQPAAIDLLGRNGRLDVARYQELNRRVPRTVAGSAEPSTLSDEEMQQFTTWKALIGSWFAWYQCAFLFGAASGGLIFGRLGDRIGRAKAMSLSIITYSAMAGAAYLSTTPEHLLICWFLACTGVGGMWPNGVALVSEAWSSMSRPMVAGVIGTSANIGIFLFATLATKVKITPMDWRWVMLAGSGPLVLGLFSLIVVPESPRWLATRLISQGALKGSSSQSEIFRPPLLWVTLVGILLATIPVIGGWCTANWMVPWADNASSNPFLKAQVNQFRSVTGIIGSLIGGWVAIGLGRRLTYALASACCLAISQYTFWFVTPMDQFFLYWVAGLGFFSGIFFGWLPLFLPELFPTRVRSTGAGVSFNFGRIATAVTVFSAGLLMEYFKGDYARIGRITSLFFALGIVAILLAPDTSRNELADGK